jgi:tetratricopeptide (TPR) repeat protein
MSTATIALAANDVDAAKSGFESAAAQTGLGRENYEAWANLFASYRQFDLAFAVLDRGLASLTAEDARQDLQIERLNVTIRSGDLVKAVQEVPRVATCVNADTPQRRKFNRTRLQLAEALLQQPDPASDGEAEACIAGVRDEEPQNQSLLALEGTLLLRKTPADLDGAESLFERASTAAGGNLTAEWGLARVALTRSDFPRALTHTDRALELTPLSPALLKQRAEILLKLGRALDVETTLNPLWAQQPDDPVALQLLASCYLDRNEPDKAKAVIEKLEAALGDKQNGHPGLRGLRSRLLMAKGSAPEAEAVLRAQVKATPDDFDAVRDLAVAVHTQGRTVEAELLIEKYAQDHASDPGAWVALAQFYEAGSLPDRLERASTALTRALLADPDYVPALREMLGVRLQQGAVTEALGLCGRYLSQNPDDPDMLNTKAGLLLDAGGQTDKAMAAIDRALQLDDQPRYRLTRGLVLIAMQDYQRALRELEPAVSAIQNTPANIDLALAEAYLATGKLDLAKQYFDAASKKAAGGDPINPARLHRVGDAIKERDSKA